MTPTFAKLSRVIAHAPGLFVSTKKGAEYKLVRLDYHVDDLNFRFIGPQLGPSELRVLQGLIGLAGPQNATFALRQEEDVSTDKLQSLLLNRAIVQTSHNQLAEAIGYRSDSGSANTTIRKALEHLFSMAVFVSRANEQSSKEHAAGHLLSKLNTAKGGTLEVELCPVLAAAVLGGRGHYLRVDLTEVRQLKTDPARLLHHRLHWINPGQKGSIGIDKLVGYVWAGPANAATQRKRHERVRDALIEMSALGWSFVKSGEVYTIKRPAISVTPTLPHRSH